MERTHPRRALVVAIEGLDGSGKSTTVRLLAGALGASVVRNPPASLAADRPRADALPPHEKRAWYLHANRVAIEEALSRAAKGAPVVLDRSVTSTLAFGAAERGEIATPGDLPAGFPMPDAIVLLEIPEAERRRRHLGRGDVATAEEQRLATDDAFRERVLAGYRRLCSHRVSACASPEDVVCEIRRAIVT
jgi:thymidylate kinase